MVLTGMLIGKENFWSDHEGQGSKRQSQKNDQHERCNCMGGDVQVETRRGCSKNGPIKIDLCSYNADPKNRREEESWKMLK